MNTDQRSTNRRPPLPPIRTLAIPGTENKIQVMEDRVADGYQPHHPDDYRSDRRLK